MRRRANHWRTAAVAAALVALPGACRAAYPRPGDGAFEPGKLIHVHLTLIPAGYVGIQPPAGSFPRFGRHGAPPPDSPEPKPGERERHRNTFGVDLPWGRGTVVVDGQTFANFGIFGSNAKQLDLSVVQPYAGPHRLTKRLFGVPGMRDKYLGIVKELAAGPFSNEQLMARVTAADATVKVLRGSDAAAGLARKEPVGPAMAGGMFGTPPPPEKFIARRTASVAAQLAGTSKGHIPSSDPGRFKVGDFLDEPALEDLDADKDGKVTQAELVTAAGVLFDEVDAEKTDGLGEDGVGEDGVGELFNVLSRQPPFFGPPPAKKDGPPQPKK